MAVNWDVDMIDICILVVVIFLAVSCHEDEQLKRYKKRIAIERTITTSSSILPDQNNSLGHESPK